MTVARALTFARPTGGVLGAAAATRDPSPLLRDGRPLSPPPSAAVSARDIELLAQTLGLRQQPSLGSPPLRPLVGASAAAAPDRRGDALVLQRARLEDLAAPKAPPHAQRPSAPPPPRVAPVRPLLSPAAQAALAERLASPTSTAAAAAHHARGGGSSGGGSGGSVAPSRGATAPAKAAPAAALAVRTFSGGGVRPRPVDPSAPAAAESAAPPRVADRAAARVAAPPPRSEEEPPPLRPVTRGEFLPAPLAGTSTAAAGSVSAPPPSHAAEPPPPQGGEEPPPPQEMEDAAREEPPVRPPPSVASEGDAPSPAPAPLPPSSSLSTLYAPLPAPAAAPLRAVASFHSMTLDLGEPTRDPLSPQSPPGGSPPPRLEAPPTPEGVPSPRAGFVGATDASPGPAAEALEPAEQPPAVNSPSLTPPTVASPAPAPLAGERGAQAAVLTAVVAAAEAATLSSEQAAPPLAAASPAPVTFASPQQSESPPSPPPSVPSVSVGISGLPRAVDAAAESSGDGSGEAAEDAATDGEAAEGGAAADGEEEEEGGEEEDEPAPDADALRCALQLLTGSLVLLKHGRRGFPHKRLVWVDARHAELLLCWGKPEAGITNPQAEAVPLTCVTGIQLGLFSAVMKRSGKASRAGLYFSLELEDLRAGWVRTLDLEAETPGQRDWLAAQLGRLLLEDSGLIQGCMLYLFKTGAWRPLPLSTDDSPAAPDRGLPRLRGSGSDDD